MNAAAIARTEQATYHETERCSRHRATGKHIDAALSSRENVLDHAYLSLGLVRADGTHLDPLTVAVIE